jgi:hypothetical protein
MPLPINTQLVQQEGWIALAIEALKQGHFASVRAAARAYDMPHSTLQNRVNGHPIQYNRWSPNCKLTITEETTLVQWILSMDQRGPVPRPDAVWQMANLLREKQSDSDSSQGSCVSKCWVINFIQQHQTLQTRYNLSTRSLYNQWFLRFLSHSIIFHDVL